MELLRDTRKSLAIEPLILLETLKDSGHAVLARVVRVAALAVGGERVGVETI